MSRITKAATVLIRAITAATSAEGELMGLVQNFQASKVIASEVVHVVGSFVPVAALYHGEQGSFSWSEAHASDRDLVARGVLPKKSELAAYEPISLRVMDYQTAKPIVHLLGCVPNSAGYAINAQQMLVSNCSGSCIFVMTGGELGA